MADRLLEIQLKSHFVSGISVRVARCISVTVEGRRYIFVEE
jgi:hypothetical protein